MQKNQKIFLAFVLIIGATLRALAIKNYGDFWFDEIFSFIYSQKPWWDSLSKFWIWETNPFLHMLLLKLWFYFIPANELTARLPSLLFGLGAIYSLYRFGQKHFDELTGRLASLLLSLNGLHVFFCATARSYALLTWLAILAMDKLFDIFWQNDQRSFSLTHYANKITKRGMIWLGILNLLIAYTHLTACLFIIGQLTVILALKKNQTILWLKINAIPFLIWLVWAIPSLASKINWQTFSASWFLTIKNNNISIINNFANILVGPITWQIGLIAIIIFISILISIIYKQLKTGNNKQTLLAVIFMIILFVFCLSILGTLNERFFVIIMPLTSIVIADFLAKKFKSKKYLAISAIFLIMSLGLYNLYTKYLPISDWKNINNVISQNIDKNKKQILVYNLEFYQPIFDRYLQLPIKTAIFEEYAYMNFDEKIITKNYLRYAHNHEQISAWIAKSHLDEYDKIILLQNQFVGIDIAATLDPMIWHSNETSYEARIGGEPHIIKTYDKN